MLDRQEAWRDRGQGGWDETVTRGTWTGPCGAGTSPHRGPLRCCAETEREEARDKVLWDPGPGAGAGVSGGEPGTSPQCGWAV